MGFDNMKVALQGCLNLSERKDRQCDHSWYHNYSNLKSEIQFQEFVMNPI